MTFSRERLPAARTARLGIRPLSAKRSATNHTTPTTRTNYVTLSSKTFHFVDVIGSGVWGGSGSDMSVVSSDLWMSMAKVARCL